MRSPIISCVLALLVLVASQGHAHADSPTQAIKKAHRRITRLLSRKVTPGTPADKRLKAQIARQVNRFLDFKELARRALGRHWAKRTEAERAEFVEILREIIERNYVKQLRSNLGYTVEYREESQRGEAARVTTAVKVKKNRRTTEIIIEYKMRRARGGWMVYDVVTDDVSIVRNYRSQFNRIIRKESYAALVKKMRKKLAEGDKSTK